MSDADLAGLIDRHEAFLRCGEVDRPLVGCWIGGYYPAEQFPLGSSSLVKGKRLRPEDVRFSPFAQDYEALFQAHRACDDDFFYVASAYWGIPWLEAILGCPVVVAEANCRAESLCADVNEAAEIIENGSDWEGMEARLGPACMGATPEPRPSGLLSAATRVDSNPWMDALLRFTRDLVEFADGRFPVCAPLLRGAGDAAAAVLGGTEFVTGMLDEPEAMKTLLGRLAQIRAMILARLGEVLPPWRGTYAAGGYPSKIWSRCTVAYYQEDCAALLSPTLFREFLLPPAREACGAAEINFVHLHSACLYPVGVLLEERVFDVIEINIDHRGSGPPVPELIPTFREIQAAHVPLLLWGECTREEWELICRELSPVGLSLQPMLSPQSARDESRALCDRCRGYGGRVDPKLDSVTPPASGCGDRQPQLSRKRRRSKGSL